MQSSDRRCGTASMGVHHSLTCDRSSTSEHMREGPCGELLVHPTRTPPTVTEGMTILMKRGGCGAEGPSYRPDGLRLETARQALSLWMHILICSSLLLCTGAGFSGEPLTFILSTVLGRKTCMQRPRDGSLKAQGG